MGINKCANYLNGARLTYPYATSFMFECDFIQNNFRNLLHGWPKINLVHN